MYSVLLVIHTILVLCLIVIILIQRSDSDGFGAGGGSNQFMTGRTSASLITRTTAILATLFILNSLLLAYLTTQRSRVSIVEKIEAPITAPVEAVKAPAPKAAPNVPSVPKPE